jgi:hypothetical protein
MPLYSFQLQGPETVVDPDYVELSSDAAAHAHAIAIVQELTFKSNMYFGHDWSEWRIVVRDSSGTEVLSLPMQSFAEH